MRASLDERRYQPNRFSFRRMYEMDIERWPEISGKKHGSEEQDWDIVLCCFYNQLNLAYCGDKRNSRIGLEDPEMWDAMTQQLVHMADAGVQEAGSARRYARLTLAWIAGASPAERKV